MAVSVIESNERFQDAWANHHRFLLDVAYRTVDSPFGPLLVAVTPVGLVRVAFELEDHDAVLAALSNSVSPRMLRSGRRTDRVARQLMLRQTCRYGISSSSTGIQM